LKLQLRATESEILFTGVNVICVVPVCPAVMGKFGSLVPKLKSGRFTVMDTEAEAGA
jgi:hypothetical protein